MTEQNRIKIKAPPRPLLDSLSAWICEQFGDTLHLCLHDLPKLIESEGKQALLDGYAELTEQGVVLLYQQYEIAPYVWGMPECVVLRK